MTHNWRQAVAATCAIHTDTHKQRKYAHAHKRHIVIIVPPQNIR